MNKLEILTHFNENLTEFFTVAKTQRDEIVRSFAYMDGHSVESEDTNVKIKKARISLAPAIVRAVAGSEVMKERSLDIVPIDSPEYDVEADIMDDAVEYAQYASDWKIAYDLVKNDTATCGLGATITMLDMATREAISGVPNCKRVHPSYLFFDTSGRGQNLNKTANFCGYADPMRTKELVKYIEQKIGNEYAEGLPTTTGTGFVDQFLESQIREQMSIDMLYHYFWREMEAVRDVQNPMFSDEAFKELMGSDVDAVEMFAGWCDETRVDIEAPYWTVDPKEFTALKDTIRSIEKWAGLEEGYFEVKGSARVVRGYYRAELAQGYVLSWSKSYSQNEYPLNFVTGYFDSSLNIYYGLMRPLSFVQDAIDIIMDNLLDYAENAANGGNIYVKGAADDIKTLKKSQANKDKVTPIGATMEIEPKELASSPQVLLETAKFLIDLLPRAIGLGPDFLGIISSGDMTDALFGKIVRQAFAVLEDFVNNSAGYSKRQCQLFMDLMISVAEVEEGRLLPVLSPGHKEEDYKRLTKQNIARQYYLRGQERPASADEQAETLKILVGLAPQLLQMGLNIVPQLLQNTRLDQKQKQELIEAATPKPTPPDPLNQESIIANIRLLNGQAAKLEADAAEKQATLPGKAPELQSIIDKNNAQAVKSISDAKASHDGNKISAIQSLAALRNKASDRATDRR